MMFLGLHLSKFWGQTGLNSRFGSGAELFHIVFIIRVFNGKVKLALLQTSVYLVFTYS